MDAYQAHATVVNQTGTLSTYAIVMDGGILVNTYRERFGDESKGYSKFALDVIQQPEEMGYELFDDRISEKKVTGSLFRTQGGLVVDKYGRVLRTDDSAVGNLYAGGGCATGTSGHGSDGTSRATD